MGARRVIGNIILFFAIIGLLINIGVTVLIVIPECTLGIAIIALGAPDLTKCDEAFINFGIGIVVSLIWIGIGLVIRGKNPQTLRLG